MEPFLLSGKKGLMLLLLFWALVRDWRVGWWWGWSRGCCCRKRHFGGLRALFVDHVHHA